jgi:phosphoribosylformylglycinamidine synthase subunit PurS
LQIKALFSDSLVNSVGIFKYSDENTSILDFTFYFCEKLQNYKFLNMKFLAHIDIMPLKELLDPQGKTVGKNMHNIGIEGIEDVRIGKHIQITIEAANKETANAEIESACKKILANLIMESYTYTLTEI